MWKHICLMMMMWLMTITSCFHVRGRRWRSRGLPTQVWAKKRLRHPWGLFNTGSGFDLLAARELIEPGNDLRVPVLDTLPSAAGGLKGNNCCCSGLLHFLVVALHLTYTLTDVLLCATEVRRWGGKTVIEAERNKNLLSVEEVRGVRDGAEKSVRF